MEIRRYGNAAITIHWLMAIMIIGMIGLGIYMVDLPKGSDERSWYFVAVALCWCYLSFA